LLKQGDWAEIVNLNPIYDHVMGWVMTEPKNGQVKFAAVRHLVKGSKFKGEQWIETKHLVLHKPKLTKAEWLEMIDWALDDWDKETFDGLMKFKEFIGG
jgi:hypothetical protein